MSVRKIITQSTSQDIDLRRPESDELNTNEGGEETVDLFTEAVDEDDEEEDNEANPVSDGSQAINLDELMLAMHLMQTLQQTMQKSISLLLKKNSAGDIKGKEEPAAIIPSKKVSKKSGLTNRKSLLNLDEVSVTQSSDSSVHQSAMVHTLTATLPTYDG